MLSFFFVARYNPHWNVPDPGNLLLALIFASWVLMANSSKNVQMSFYFPGATYLATRSYSMYLLHPEALALISDLAPSVPFPVYLALTLVVTAALSKCLYRVVELLFMNAREKYGRSRSLANSAST